MSAQSLLTVLTNPRAFFEDLDERPVGLLVPALIVLAGGIISAIAAYQIAAVTARMIPALGEMGGVIGIIGGISALIMGMLMWVIIAAIFFVISMAFKGTGDFRRLLAYVGYGELPQVIGSVAYLALTWNFIGNLRVPSITDPQMIAEWTSALMKDPTMRLASVVALVFLLWSANIWIFGVRSSRRLSMRDAAITVGVPTLLYVVYTLYTLVA
jgi:hypothetical protein